MTSTLPRALPSWRRAQTFLRPIYGPDTFIYPVDQPSYCEGDRWWHFVMPCFEPGALERGFVRDAASRAALRTVERLAIAERPLWVRGLRIDPSYVEFVSHGHFDDRNRARARLGRAIALSYRKVTGQRLRWERTWAAMLRSREEHMRCITHLRLTSRELEAPPTGGQSYDEFMQRLMAS